MAIGFEQPKNAGRISAGLLFVALAIALAIAGSGCGESPGPEDLLTLVELESVNGGYRIAPGDTSIPARVKMTFRDWFNGGVVVEARVSSSVSSAQIAALLASGGAEAHAAAWDLVMAGSSSAGMAARAMVGYRGLIREHDFILPLSIPSGDSSGNPFTGAFIVGYLADVEEVEIDGQPDSLILIPYGRPNGILNDVAVVQLGNP